MMCRAWRGPRGVCRMWRRSFALSSELGLRGSILVTGVFVCRFSPCSFTSFSSINATSLYGHRLAATAVSITPGAPFTLSFRISSSFSITLTSFPISGSAFCSSRTSLAAALASAFVQNDRQPGRARHSQGMSLSDM